MPFRHTSPTTTHSAQKNPAPTFTQCHQTMLISVMRYTVETSNTVAGSVLVGIYNTLEEAKLAAKSHRCQIRPIYNTSLDQITSPATLADLIALLDNIEETD